MGESGVALVLEPADGTLRHALTLVRALVEQGTRVEVFAGRNGAGGLDGGRRVEELAAAGAHLVDLDIAASAGPRDAAAIGRLRRALRADQVDVVHAIGLRAGLIAALARIAGTPFVVTWPATGVGRGLGRLTRLATARTVAGSADVVLCATAELVDTAVRSGARDARLAPFGAPTLAPALGSGDAGARGRDEIRAEFDVVAPAQLVLAAGRLSRPSRHDVLVTAAARWRALRPPPTVIVAGTGPEYRTLAGQIVVARAPIILAGQRDVAELLPAADIAVVTGETDAGALFAQEALVAGVPLVCAAAEGVAELVGGAAVLVPPGDADALDEAVRSLLADPDRRAARARAGRAWAAAWPSEADAAGLVIELYAALGTRDAPRDLR